MMAAKTKPTDLDELSLDQNYKLNNFEDRTNQRIEKLGGKVVYIYDQDGIEKRETITDASDKSRNKLKDLGKLRDIVEAYGVATLNEPVRTTPPSAPPIEPLPFDELPQTYEPLPFDELPEPIGEQVPFDIPVERVSAPTPGPERKSVVGSVARGQAKSQAEKYAERKILSSTVGKRVTSLAAKAGAKLATTAAATAVKGAVSAVSGLMSGGVTLAIQAGLLAVQNADKIFKALGSFAIAIVGLINNGIVLAMGSGWTTFGIALIAVPFTIAAFLIIINTGAYITPGGEGILFGGGRCGTAEKETVECFIFDTSWGCATDAEKQRVKSAIPTILGKQGVKELVCAQDTTLGYEPRGLVAGGITREHGDYVGFSPVGTSENKAALYTLSHELGHVLNWRYSFVWQYYIEEYKPVQEEGYLPSYPLAKTLIENQAEAFGLYLMRPEQHTKIGNFEANYPAHFEYVDAVFHHF